MIIYRISIKHNLIGKYFFLWKGHRFVLRFIQFTHHDWIISIRLLCKQHQKCYYISLFNQVTTTRLSCAKWKFIRHRVLFCIEFSAIFFISFNLSAYLRYSFFLSQMPSIHFNKKIRCNQCCLRCGVDNCLKTTAWYRLIKSECLLAALVHSMGIPSVQNL